MASVGKKPLLRLSVLMHCPGDHAVQVHQTTPGLGFMIEFKFRVYAERLSQEELMQSSYGIFQAAVQGLGV